MDFVFIAAYWLLFIALSALLAQRDITLAVPLAVVAAVCATAAAQVDFLENLRLLALLDTTTEASDNEISWIAKGVRDAALLKFGLSFVAAALLAQIFLWRDDWWIFAIGILYLIAAAIGLFGVWWYPAAVQWGLLPSSPRDHPYRGDLHPDTPQDSSQFLSPSRGAPASPMYSSASSTGIRIRILTIKGATTR